MSLALNKPKLDNLADQIWKSAERLRGKFKAYEYQNVILPIIVIRRLECVLIKWREDKAAEVKAKRPKLTDKELSKLVKDLETSNAPFSNKTKWTLRRVYEEDHTLLEENFRAYINGFSKNVDDIIEHFNYRATIGQVVKNNRLAPILNQYKELELGPDKLSPLEMGYIYEELLRRFSEQSGEEAGEHFTPREVIRLMVELLDIPIPERHLSIYDPACGTGGMLSVAKEHLLDRASTPAERSNVEKFVTVHGEELSPTNYAICQADLLIKNDQQAKVHPGNSLIPHDAHSKEPGDQFSESKFRFDFMLSNPPFGVTWGGKDGYETEARKLEKTRYRAGMPRVNDGALLFLQTMLGKMKEPEKGTSRIAIIFNGSPLSNGDCGQGESEIRRWILENDWLDAIVMLPDQLFYNTGIFTYVWLLRNDKPVSHKGRVMLIDARQQFEKEPKSFGAKRTLDISDGFGSDALKRMLVILGRIPKDPLAIAGFTRATDTLVGWWRSGDDREERRSRNFHAESEISQRLQEFLLRTTHEAAKSVLGPVLGAIDRHSSELQTIMQGLTGLQDSNPNTEQYWFLWSLFAEAVKGTKWLTRLN